MSGVYRRHSPLSPLIAHAASFCDPTFFHYLARPPQSQRTVRYVFGDDAARGGIRLVADCNGRDQCGVAAHKYIVTDGGRMLAHAIVVTRDGARADVGALTEVSIA